MGGVQVGVEGRHLRRGDPLQDALLHLEHRHLQAHLHGYRGNLQADVAAADDGDAFAGLEVLPDCVHIGDRAQVVDARELGAGSGELARARAGGEQELVIGEGFTVCTR